MITINGKEVSSELIVQSFTDPRYFRGRVSFINYNTYTEADAVPNKNGVKAYN